MNAQARPEHSLLVKVRPGAAPPYELEDLRTGRRRHFGALADLLAALGEALEADPVTSTE